MTCRGEYLIWAQRLGACLLVVLGGLALSAPPVGAQACSCDTVPETICSAQGFGITLLGFYVDQEAGTSSWDYEVCNDKGMMGVCVPPQDLRHVDIDLPALGSCLTNEQDIMLAQVGGFANATLDCGVSEKDPSCGIEGTPGTDFVAKCDVDGGNLDAGECVTMRLSIAGELPTLGYGAAMTVTKAGQQCADDCILGPSCEPCGEPPEDECLTRTPGFWGTHPHITDNFLPVTVCDEVLNVTTAGTCDSATEAMCVSPGRESRTNRAYAQLVRQLTAAKLNLAATAANGGSCEPAGIDTIIFGCERDFCGANQKQISGSGCIEALDAFNNSQDGIDLTPSPFDSPGPADPTQCRLAKGNGFVIGKDIQGGGQCAPNS